MPLKRVPYRSLRALLRRELVREEHPPTAALIRRLAHVKRAGRFTRGEFLAMCRWKSPRARLHYERNSAATIRRASAAALGAQSERERIAVLTALPGVSVATASAILTLIDPLHYGVLDIRCWQLLFHIRSVEGNASGRGFTIPQWEQYLTRLRGHARALDVSARMIEYTLFHCHRKLQRGRLYDRAGARPAARRRAPAPPAPARRAAAARPGRGR
ncbi:MAG TPA: hypothetical protein VJX92_01705 [Methylomirabilota bacterium]|nr:hypothetical protein [Methylomirabilota bacterium]